MMRTISLYLAAVAGFAAPNAKLVAVVAKPVSRTIDLPGELQPYLNVQLHAKVAGYVERVLVDRGSVVKPGELLIELSAPEMKAQLAEAEAKVHAAEADRLQAEAQLASVRSTAEGLQEASKTAGAVAGNELIVAQKQVETAEALVRSREQARGAAEAAVHAQKELEAYLKITAPFDGVVTERMVHPGALVGPGSDGVMLTIEQISHLRLVVPVPEEDAGMVSRGTSVTFHVPAYPERVYTGTIARIAHALDSKTRTMPVELDVQNRDGSLAPGMYPNVKWPVRREQPALYVPKTSVVTTTERIFVIRNRNGHAEYVDVKKGVADGDLVEVMGNLHAGDMVVKRGTDELREGAAI